MNIYEKIKNPLNDRENLMKFVELYSANEDLYNNIIVFSEDKNGIKETTESYAEFLKNILLPAIQRKVEEIKGVDIDKYTQVYNELKQNYWEQKQAINEIEKHFFMPIEKYQIILNKYSLSEMLKVWIKEKENYRHIGAYKELNPKLYEKLKKETVLSNEECEIIEFVNKIYTNFRESSGRNMGFHVSPNNLSYFEALLSQAEPVNPEIKFYINAGKDSYKVAKMFWDKCEQEKINYYFKVTDPERKSERDRADKVCIYSELKDVTKIIGILNEIRKENPDIHFEKPPILVGNIDDFIGVGVDQGPSHNKTVTRIIKETCEKFFVGIEKDKIVDYVKMNPEILDELRSKIIEEGTKYDLSEEKFCITNEVGEYLKQLTFPGNNINFGDDFDGR